MLNHPPLGAALSAKTLHSVGLSATRWTPCVVMNISPILYPYGAEPNVTLRPHPAGQYSSEQDRSEAETPPPWINKSADPLPDHSPARAYHLTVIRALPRLVLDMVLAGHSKQVCDSRRGDGLWAQLYGLETDQHACRMAQFCCAKARENPAPILSQQQTVSTKSRVLTDADENLSQVYMPVRNMPGVLEPAVRAAVAPPARAARAKRILLSANSITGPLQLSVSPKPLAGGKWRGAISSRILFTEG